MNVIETTTKPSGAWTTWIELGQWVEKEDTFGDSVQTWVPSTIGRYPQQDQRLTVKRDFDGSGDSQRIHWKITVPDQFPLVIRIRTGDARSQDRERILYDPASPTSPTAHLTQTLPTPIALLAQIVAAHDQHGDLASLIEQARLLVQAVHEVVTK